MPPRRALTIVELLVVIFVIGILLALLVPAINAARNAARRVQCQNNLRQLAMACSGYAGTHDDTLPDIANGGVDYHRFSWRASILPYVKEQPLHDQIDFAKSPDDRLNLEVGCTHLPVYRCPSSWAMTSVPGQTDYFAIEITGADSNRLPASLTKHHHSYYLYEAAGAWMNRASHHVAARHSPARLKKIRDGLSKTLLVVERANKADSWISLGTGSDLRVAPYRVRFWDAPREVFNRINAPEACVKVGPHRLCRRESPMFGYHRGGANVAMCDGSVRFLVEEAEEQIICALLTRSSGEANHTIW